MTKDDEVKLEMVALLRAAQMFFSEKMNEEDKKSMLWNFDDSTKEEKNAFYAGIQQSMSYINKTMDDPVFPVEMFDGNIEAGVH